MKRVILTALSIGLLPVLGYGQLPPLDAAEGTWMMHHGAASMRGLQRLKGAITGPYVRCDNFFATAEGDPIVADINGDGSNEIVMAAFEYGQVYAFRGTDCSLLWSRNISSSAEGSSSVAVGELDPTRPGLEIAVVVDVTQQLYVLSGTDGSIIWSNPLNDVFLSAPTIADIDGDGIGEIFVSSSYTTYAFGGNGTLLWSYPAGYKNSLVAVGDLGNDGTLEVVFVGWSSSTGWQVFALRATNGTLVWSYPISSVGNVALADLDNDGQLEVVVVYHGGGVIALRHNGNFYWSRTFPCDACTPGESSLHLDSPTIADLDGDGIRDIIVGCFTQEIVYALRGMDGSTIWTYSGSTSGFQSSSRKIGDIDGDGALEVVLASYQTLFGWCSSCPYHLIVLDGATGTVEWTWNNPLGFGFEGLAIADVDNDGCMEIIVGPNAAGGARFYVFDSPTPVSDCGVLGYEDPVKVEEDRNIGGVYLLVSPVKGGVNVETGRKAFVEIYTTDGRKVKGLEVDRSAFVELKKGTYIFRVKGHNLYRTVIVR
jgi:outer membrane protein assembly factor BamB